MSASLDRNARQIALVREIDGFFREARIRYWLRGGWALDFILGKITREHGDIDLVAWKRNERRIARLFEDHGFRMTRHVSSSDFDKNDEQANVLFLEKGDGVVYTAGFQQEPRWNEDVLCGPMRELAGLGCRTISPGGLLEELEKTPGWLGRPPRAKDAQTKATLDKLVAASTATPSRKQLGDFGERMAAAHLQAKGYEIIDRKFRVRDAEIDLIARDGETLVFVEVRTRRGAYPGMAALSITRGKAKKLLIAVQHYAMQHPDIADAALRIDAVTIELDAGGKLSDVTHIEDAVRPDRRS